LIFVIHVLRILRGEVMKEIRECPFCERNLPDISQVEIIEDCRECSGAGYIEHKDRNIIIGIACENCEGTGKVSRPATLDDIVSETLSTLGIGSGGLNLPSGGILKLKEG